MTSLENDSLFLAMATVGGRTLEAVESSTEARTGVIDASLLLFQELLPKQPVNALMQAVTLMNNHLRSPKMERNAGRRQAALYNVILALQRALENAWQNNSRQARESIGHGSVTGLIKRLLQVCVLASDEIPMSLLTMVSYRMQ